MKPDELLELVADKYPQPPFAVAVSGGADSAVALWAGVQLARDEPVTAIHVHHGWLGSDAMYRAATAVAAALGLGLRYRGVGRDDDPPANETEAREFRLAALIETAPDLPIVTGHNRDDDAETVLGNLLRGAGATGLAGIPATRTSFHRPLLTIGRADIRTVADELRLPYADDPANDDRAHRRNRIRHDVLPLLESLEPGVTDRLLRTAAALAADDAALDAIAQRVPIRSDDDGVVLVPYGHLVTAAPAVAARVVRRVLRAAHPPYSGSAADVAAALSVADSGRVTIEGGITVEREGPFLAFIPGTTEVARPVPRDDAALPVPGEVVIGKHRISAQPASVGTPLRIGRGVAVVRVEADELSVGIPRSGDRIDIRDGSKSVSDALMEARIPLRHRRSWPVVRSRGRIIWIAGVRVAHPAAQRAGSGDRIRLVAERL